MAGAQANQAPARADGPELAYGVALERWPATLRARFVQLSCDPATEAYLSRATRQRHGRLATLLHRTLRNLWSDYDVNGVLGMYPMHLLSSEQWQRLLGPAAVARCLDVGAGCGDVTMTLKPLCTELEASETSPAMARRLRARGIPCRGDDLARPQAALGTFDLITCLNVLDRCPLPLTLLRTLRSALAPEGRLVLALALPCRPFYFEGANTPDPKELLDCTGDTWEACAARFYERVLSPLGLSLEVISRVPYLSWGDAHSPLYVLDDVLVVLCNRSA